MLQVHVTDWSNLTGIVASGNLSVAGNTTLE
jgi:hypothetical protein